MWASWRLYVFGWCNIEHFRSTYKRLCIIFKVLLWIIRIWVCDYWRLIQRLLHFFRENSLIVPLGIIIMWRASPCLSHYHLLFFFFYVEILSSELHIILLEILFLIHDVRVLYWVRRNNRLVLFRWTCIVNRNILGVFYCQIVTSCFI